MPCLLFFALIGALGFESDFSPIFHHPLPGEGFLPVCTESLNSYDVRHYELNLDLPMNSSAYFCHERVSLKSNLPLLDTVQLDFAGLVCDSVRYLGRNIPFDTPPGYLLVPLDPPLPAGESTIIEIFFHRGPNAPQRGFFFAQPPTVRYAHAMTCGCPRDNHYWFACWDLPNDKAERGCALNITVPDTFQACANGLLDSVTVSPGGKRTWWWRHPYPICTYLMTFSASRFARWDTIVVDHHGDTIPLIYFIWPPDSAASRSAYCKVPDMMLYYSHPERFGNYPFERFGLVPGYYGFPWGGMEHQTQVMIHPSYLNGGGEATICHELAHMWWGDMVTHVGYADVWLNEGFATWAECLYMGHLNGKNYFQQYIAGKARQYFSQHRRQDFPIYNPPWQEIYNYGIIYCKGSWILRMLQYLTGDTAWQTPGIFFQALRTYGDSFRYRTVATPDFQRIIEQVTGLNLNTFFQEWIYDRGYPKFYLYWTKFPAGDSWQVLCRLTQRNDTNSCSLFHIPLPIRLSGVNETLVITLDGADTTRIDTFQINFEPLSITPDPDNWILDSCYVVTVGIAELVTNLNSAITVVPNPGRERLCFSLPATYTGELKIYDRCGREVFTAPVVRQSFVWHRIDHQGRRLPAGVYFVQFCNLLRQPFKVVLTE